LHLLANSDVEDGLERGERERERERERGSSFRRPSDDVKAIARA
jgi:hypothetical protein